ncbi:hypothetical protein D3C78_1735720 [compost metagenome]
MGDAALAIQQYHARDVADPEGSEQGIIFVQRQGQAAGGGFLIVLQIGGRDPEAG